MTVLRDGKLIGSMPVTEKTTKEELTCMMVGREVLFEFVHTDAVTGQACLEMVNICANNDKGIPILQNFSLSIKTGEILGLAGVDGNGQKELAEVLTGLRLSTGGEISLCGKAATCRPPLYYIREGVAHIPEDRHHTGLAMGFSIAKNLIIKNYSQPPYAKHKLLEYKRIESHAKDMVDKYAIKSNSVEDFIKDLSGGNQQKVILAREISGNPRVLIASQPTRGLDIGATEYVRERIMDTRNKGTAVLLISADLEEILQLSDRIAVIYSGKLMGILPRGADVQEIGMMMMGKCQEVLEYAQ